MKKIGVAILGSTGSVGQQFVRFLDHHPTFDVRVLTASRNNVGKTYPQATKWYADYADIPEYVKDMRIVDTSVSAVKEIGDVSIVFSALPADVSRDLEPQFAKEGLTVISKTSAFRMNPLVPLLVPEVNPDHLDMLTMQKRKRHWDGAIIADPNCTTTGLVLCLKPLQDHLRLKNVIVTTMQATSGAGYLGISPVVIMDNALPFIRGEEEKIRTETKKIFGHFERNAIKDAGFGIDATCTRVPVSYGHMEDVYVETEEPCEVDDVKRLMRRFRGVPQELGLHTAPEAPLVVRDEDDRPQPKLDVNTGKGMSVVVGRIRQQLDGIRFMLLVHNTIRGGAGMAVLNAELVTAKGLHKELPQEYQTK